VANLATGGLAGTRLHHAFRELAAMRIAVAAGAGAVLEPVPRYFLSSRTQRLVTITAGHRNMASGQLKPGVLVLRQRECGRPKSLDRVARLATVQQGRGCELSLVSVAVTIHALGELDAIKRCLTRGQMAFLAAYRRVLALQRVTGGFVLHQSKLGRLEAFHGMAPRALAGVGALQELAAVRIRTVAIAALLECDRLFEIAARVALLAAQQRVFSYQWVFRTCVIELACQHRGRH
jgi:hypothetical protein